MSSVIVVTIICIAVFGYLALLATWWLAFILGPSSLLFYFLRRYRNKKSYYLLLILVLAPCLIYEPMQVYLVLVVTSLILAYLWLWKYWKHPFVLFFATLIILPGLGYKIHGINYYMKFIPSQIGISYPVAFGSEFGMREGCGVAIYRITKSTQEAINKEGLAFFDTALRGRGYINSSDNVGRTYQEWNYGTHIGYGDASEVSIFKCPVINGYIENDILKASKQGFYETRKNKARLIVIPSGGYIIYDARG